MFFVGKEMTAIRQKPYTILCQSGARDFLSALDEIQAEAIYQGRHPSEVVQHVILGDVTDYKYDQEKKLWRKH